MYAGGGQFTGRRPPQEEERLFYQGYGPTEADPVGLAYYRYERIVQDIAALRRATLIERRGGEDREQSLYYLKSNFLPNGVLEIAYRSEGKLRQKDESSFSMVLQARENLLWLQPCKKGWLNLIGICPWTTIFSSLEKWFRNTKS